MVRAAFSLGLAIACGSLGHLLLSKGMHAMGPLEDYHFLALFHYFGMVFYNPSIIGGILLEIVYFLLWMLVLSFADVSWAVPMNALEYLVVAFLAGSFLGDTILLSRWIGIFFIIFGIFFMMRSWEKT